MVARYDNMDKYIIESMPCNYAWSYCINKNGSFFFEDCGDLCKFFSPQFRKEKGVVRIRGWIGLFLKDDVDGQRISLDKLEVNGGYSISMRLENFPDISYMGVFDTREGKIGEEFFIGIKKIFDDEIPNNIRSAGDMLKNSKSWIYKLALCDTNGIYEKSLEILRHGGSRAN